MKRSRLSGRPFQKPTYTSIHLSIVIWNTYELNTFSGRKDNPDIKAYISPRLLSGLVNFIQDNPYFSCDDPIIDSDNLLQIIQNKMKSYWNYNTFSPIGNKAQYKMHEKEQYQLGYRLPNITKGDIVINVHLKRQM